MTRNEIYLFHVTGLPLSWIKHALQECNNNPFKARDYLKEKYGNNKISSK